MAEHGSGGGGDKSGAWYQVPTWDGSPLTWREFRREMRWWTQSLDLASTTKYNLAARWLLRQTGIVRQRGEEFDPDELCYKPAVMAPDPDHPGEELELEPPNYLAGLEKLLQALEMINGQTALDKRGELRQQFYQDLRRRPGERLSEFCTRFRTLVADLRSEGVQLPSEELGWFLRDKLGLDPLRKQMLDTALAGREKYEVIEAEVLRLFKDIHLADPLFRRSDSGNRPKLTIRNLDSLLPLLQVHRQLLAGQQYLQVHRRLDVHLHLVAVCVEHMSLKLRQRWNSLRMKSWRRLQLWKKSRTWKPNPWRSICNQKPKFLLRSWPQRKSLELILKPWRSWKRILNRLPKFWFP